MKTEDFKVIAENIPHLPGVYRFLDEEGVILYVGKAKILKNRNNPKNALNLLQRLAIRQNAKANTRN